MKEICEKCNKPLEKPIGKSRYPCISCRKIYAKIWLTRNREHASSVTRGYRNQMRMDALTAYAGNPPKCACCGESNMQFLTIDHKNNDGKKHRKELKNTPLVLWLKRQNYPSGFQVLCFNCNCGKSVNHGICPHELTHKTK